MAKQTKAPVNENVLLTLGYWNKYVMPVDAATQIMSLLIKSGAVKVEEDQNAYLPQLLDVTVRDLDHVFVGDVPVSGKEREEYKAWIKTKKGIVGDAYVPEPFAVFLDAKEEEA